MGHKFDRRDFLKFLGLAGAGSFLNSALPIYQSFAAGGSAPLRLLIIPKYYGWMTRQNSNDDLAIEDSAASYGFRLPDYFSSLEKHKNKMIVIENLRGTYWGNAHDHSYANILTNACVQNEMTSKQLAYNEPMGPSIDWLIGQRLNKQVLRYDQGIGRGAPICFDDKFVRQAMATNIDSLHKEIIKPILDYQNGASESDLMLRQVNNLLFDSVGRSVEQVEKLLQGTGDEARKIASFKKTLELAHPQKKIITSTLSSITDPGKVGTGDIFERMTQALKIVKAAFVADTRRVGVVSLSGDYLGDKLIWKDMNGVTQTGMDKVHDEWLAMGNTSNVGNFHHLVSHYDWSKGNARLCMNGSIKLFLDTIAQFVDELSTTIDIDGRPMIDNTCILLTSEIATGVHDRSRQPIILIGGGSKLKLGRSIKGPVVNTNNVVINTLTRDGRLVRSGFRGSYIGLRTQGDVFVSLAKAMGVDINTFGFEPHNSVPFNLTS